MSEKDVAEVEDRFKNEQVKLAENLNNIDLAVKFPFFASESFKALRGEMKDLLIKSAWYIIAIKLNIDRENSPENLIVDTGTNSARAPQRARPSGTMPTVTRSGRIVKPNRPAYLASTLSGQKYELPDAVVEEEVEHFSEVSDDDSSGQDGDYSDNSEKQN